MPIFGFEVPQACEGVSDQSILNPENTWEDKGQFNAKLKELAESFVENFKKKNFAEGADADVLAGAPKL